MSSRTDADRLAPDTEPAVDHNNEMPLAVSTGFVVRGRRVRPGRVRALHTRAGQRYHKLADHDPHRARICS